MQPSTNSLMRRLLAGAILVAGVCNVAIAQDLSAKMPVDPKVKKGKLPNGLTYYIRPNSKPEKKVEIRLMVNVGSIVEDDDQLGLAHFMEHMNFNGIKGFQKNDMVSYLQSIGVQFGADLNATTGFDETFYYLPIPTDKPENLDKAFQIAEGWAHDALLTDKDIDEERNVVLEESRLGKGAEDRMLKKYLPVVLEGSRYKDRLPIGKDETLKTFKYDVLRRFHKDWYRPDLQAIAIVGDIDEATAMKYLNKYFAPLKNPAKERPRTLFEIPGRTKPGAMVVTDKEAIRYNVQILFPSVKKTIETTVGDYKKDIERNLITSMWRRRLNELSRGSNPPFTFAAVGYDNWGRGYENLVAQAGFGADGAEKAVNALTAELIRVKNFGFTANELELSKRDVASTYEKMYNERNTTESAEYVDEYMGNFFENEPIPGIENEYNYSKELLPTITVADLNAEAKSWLNNMNNFFALITGPEAGSKLPTDAELLTMTQKGLLQDVKPLEEKKIADNLLDKMPTPGKVVSKEEDKELAATTYTLSNGVKVTIKSTEFKSDEILFRGIRKGGINNYDVADKYNVNYATAVVGAMGFGSFTPTDLEKALSGKTAKAGVSIGEIQDQVAGSSSVKDFETMLQLTYLKLTSPRMDKDLFNAFKNKQKMQMQFLSANPQIAFVDTLYSVLYQKNPLAPIAIPKAAYFDAINPDRAVEIYKKEVCSADGYQFFLVGNIKQETAIPLIEKYLGGLPSNNTTPSFKDNGVRPVTGGSLNFKKGTEKKSLILGIYEGDMPYSEEADLKANMLAEILNIRVVEELREKLGGIYGGGYGASLEPYPYSHYTVQLQLPCGPENVDKLVKAANEVVAAIKKDGPSLEDLNKVKAEMHEQIRQQEKENGYWLENLQEILFWNKQQKSTFLNYNAMIDKITVNDIKDITNQMFTDKNQFMAILNPES
ncbi:MAG: hypothetical protein BGO70_16885 [Bacteroidetes bacterium 43-93]|nr:insulinase family protein [Bacteroidota bacterium]OJX01430.1 MAG: hypothetical protein BGO70_16885 [Bacteroidetes bacterium 43-93]